MAITFVSARNGWKGLDSAGPHTVLLPTGIQENDLVIISVAGFGSNRNVSIAGWTNYEILNTSGSPYTAFIEVFHKLVTAADVSAGSVGMTISGGSSADGTIANVVAYRGVKAVASNTTRWYGQNTSTAYRSVGGNPALAVDGAWFVGIAGGEGSGFGSFTGLTQRHHDSNYPWTAVGDRVLTNNESPGLHAINLSSGSSWGSHGLVLEPSPANTYDEVVLADGASVYLPLHDAPGSTSVANARAANLPSTAQNVTFGVSDGAVPGSPGTAAQGQNRTDGFITVAHTRRVTTFTTEIWARPTTTTTLHTTASGQYAGTSGDPEYCVYPSQNGAGNGDTQAGVGIAVGTNGVIAYAHSGNYLPCIVHYHGAISSTAFHHIVLVVANNIPNLYIDGVLVATGPTAAKTLSSTDYLFGGGSYGGYQGEAMLYAVYPTALTAEAVKGHYDMGRTPPPGAPAIQTTAIHSAWAYGTRAYGGGFNVAPEKGKGALYADVAGQATVTIGTPQVARRSGDIVVYDPTMAPQDIEVRTSAGPDSMHTVVEARSTVTMGQGTAYNTVSRADGVATASSNTGVRYRTLTQSNGVGGARDQLGAAGTWYLGSSMHMQGLLAGRAGCTDNRLSVLLAGNAIFPTPVYTYTSTPNAEDVGLAGSTGPGEYQSLISTAVGEATVTMDPSRGRYLGMNPQGRAGVRDQLGAIGSWYMGSSTHLATVAAGATVMRDQLGNLHSWYLGSNIRQEAVSAGKGGAKDQFNGLGRWYLGSSTHMTATSNGRGGSLTNRIGAREFLTTTVSNGKAAWTKHYLSSPMRMTATSAGKAGCTKNYMSSPVPIATLFTGRAGANIYLGSPFHVTSESKGKATVNVYMASRVYFAGTSPGRSANYGYLGSPIHTTIGQWTSRGRAGGIVYLGGTMLLPNTVMRGVGGWVLGETFLNGYSNGVGRLLDNHLAGTQRITARFNGVGGMRENTILLHWTANGSSKGTEFDKPPFEFEVFAGCNVWGGPGGSQYVFRGFKNLPNHLAQSHRSGVAMYLSSRVYFANNDPNRHHTNSYGPSTMAGRSTFTFPYEMVARADAGCRAFHGYLADYNYGPRPTAPWDGYNHSHNNQGMTGPSGVFATQTGRVYMNWDYDAHGQDYHQRVRMYLSSRVYADWRSQGRSTAFFRRIDEMDVNGVGGMEPTLGADNRQILAQSNGVGGWPINYLPDTRLLHMQVNGVAKAWGYQAGNVHFGIVDEFGNGIFQSRGVGTFSIDPGLMYATSRGVGRMLDILRPDQVGMAWGSGKWFYERHFPLIAPLLIPNGSNGMSEFIAEIDGVAIIHHHMDGKATGTLSQEGIEKPMRLSEARSGSYPWIEYPVETEDYESVSVRRPYRAGIDHPGLGINHVFHPQGVELFFSPVEKVWTSNGVGRLIPRMKMAYALRWQRHDMSGDSLQPGALPYTSNDRYIDENGFLESSGSGRVGGIGRASLKGDRMLVMRSRGRADVKIRKDLSGRFAHNLFAKGVAAMLRWEIGGGSPPLDRYGNMLRYFFVPLPTFGQIWPRKERQHGQPV